MLFPSMRALPSALILPLALIVGLSACGQDPAKDRKDRDQLNSIEIVETADNRVTATDPGTNAGANESVAADRADTMPIALQGRWTGAKDRCTDAGAELELQITPKELIFHESVGTITRITLREGGKVAIDAAFTGEGESWTRRLQAHTSADGKTLTIANDGQAVVRKRCDTPA